MRLLDLCSLKAWGGFKLDLSKEDTAILKAFAILAVISHNWFHNVVPAPGENEMFFNPQAFWNVVDAIVIKPLDFFHPVMSFFGHYGVHIFLFLSGYGLTKKIISLTTKKELSLIGIYQVVLKQILKIIKLEFIKNWDRVS